MPISNPTASSDEGLTFSRVVIDQAEAGTVTLLAKTASQTQRLHELVGTIDAIGSIKITNFDDDGDVFGDMPLNLNGGLVFRFVADPNGTIRHDTPGEGLKLTSTGGGFHGHAIVSTGI